MIELFFDISSPWTYLAFHNIQPLAKEFNTPIRWRPFMVGGVFNSINPSVYAMRENPVPAKWNYMKKDLEDWAHHSGLKIIFPPKVFPVNSVKVMRACLVLEDTAQLLPFATQAFESYWSRNEDISQDTVVTAICERSGVAAPDLFSKIGQQNVKDQLKANTEELIARGGFGSPTIYVNGKDMYFGNDRLPLIRAALEKARGKA